MSLYFELTDSSIRLLKILGLIWLFLVVLKIALTIYLKKNNDE